MRFKYFTSAEEALKWVNGLAGSDAVTEDAREHLTTKIIEYWINNVANGQDEQRDAEFIQWVDGVFFEVYEYDIKQQSIPYESEE